MSEVLNLYPMLNENQIQTMEYKTESLEFSYIDNYEEFPLSFGIENEFPRVFSSKLSDPRCEWYPDSKNLILRKKMYFNNTHILFGKKGIAPKSSVIGVAINWISSKSDHRGIILVGEISNNTNSYSFDIEHKFEKSILRGSLSLQTILYLKKEGIPEPDEFFLANKSGTTFGVLDQCELFIDGNGSVFPIATVNEPGKPLWWVYYDSSTDPLTDSFDEENVEIRLNTAHHNYESLKIDSSLKDSPLFLEVISSALMIIIDSAKETLGSDWETVLSGQGFERGSIAEAIYYFVSKLQWDISTPVSLSASIHEFFDNNLQGGLL